MIIMVMYNRVVHFEIQASEPEELAKFYTNVFGWEIRKWDSTAMDYWTIITGPDREPGVNGGMVKRSVSPPTPEQGTNAYACTINVENLDEMIKKATDNGARMAMEKFAIPGYAWVAYCLDPDNNVFGMIQEDREAE
jgi:uncharacterized protein